MLSLKNRLHCDCDMFSRNEIPCLKPKPIPVINSLVTDCVLAMREESLLLPHEQWQWHGDELRRSHFHLFIGAGLPARQASHTETSRSNVYIHYKTSIYEAYSRDLRCRADSSADPRSTSSEAVQPG